MRLLYPFAAILSKCFLIASSQSMLGPDQREAYGAGGSGRSGHPLSDYADHGEPWRNQGSGYAQCQAEPGSAESFGPARGLGAVEETGQMTNRRRIIVWVWIGATVLTGRESAPR